MVNCWSEILEFWVLEFGIWNLEFGTLMSPTFLRFSFGGDQYSLMFYNLCPPNSG